MAVHNEYELSAQVLFERLPVLWAVRSEVVPLRPTRILLHTSCIMYDLVTGAADRQAINWP